MINKKRICTGLIIFGFVGCLALCAEGTDDSGGSDPTMQSAPVTLSLTLPPLLDFNYNPNYYGQVTLYRIGDSRLFSSNPDNHADGSPLYISSQLDGWQLDVNMTNGGKLVQADTDVSTVNKLVIKLYTDPYEDDDPAPVNIVDWPSGDNPIYTMITMPKNNLITPYYYYAKYDIATTPMDPGGIYSGTVTWTVSPLLM